MKNIKDQELLKKLFDQADRIEQDFDQLKTAIKESEEADETIISGFSGFFDYLQKEFDVFSDIAREISNPSEVEGLKEVKDEISALYSRFYTLRARWLQQASKERGERELLPEEEPEPDPEEEGDSEEESPSSEEMEPEPEAEEKKAKKKKRIIRGPARPADRSETTRQVSPEVEKAEFEKHRDNLQQEKEKQVREERNEAEQRWREAEAAAYRSSNPQIFEPIPRSTVTYTYSERRTTISGYAVPQVGQPVKYHSSDRGILSRYYEYKQLTRYDQQNPEVATPKAAQPQMQHRYTPKPGSPVYSQSWSRPESRASGNHPSKNFGPQQEKYNSNQGRSERRQKPAAKDQVRSHGKRYTLSKITTGLGNGVTMTVQQNVNRMVGKIDNDDVRFAMQAEYYVYTGKAAIGMVHHGIKRPTSGLQASAKMELSSRQMAKYNSQAVRTQRNLHREISHKEQQRRIALSAGRNHQEAERLTRELKELRSQRPSAKKAADVSRKVQSFQRQRKLDQEIIEGLSDHGKLYRRAKPLREVSTTFVRKKSVAITQEFGEQALTRSPKAIQKEINTAIRKSQALKSQMRLLERQGASLSPENRRLLAELKKKSTLMGKQIGKQQKLKRELEDLAYINKRIDDVLQRAGKFHQNALAVAGFLRSTALRPLYSPENNTEALAYGINFAANPTVQRLVSGTVKTVVKAPAKAFSTVAPEVSNRLLYKKMEEKEKISRVIRTEKKHLKKKAKQAGKNVLEAAPETVKRKAVSAGKRYRKLRESANHVSTGVYEKVQKMKKWMADTRLAKLHSAAAVKIKSISEFFEKAKLLFTAAIRKALLILLLAILLLGCIPGVISVIATVCSSVIMAPDTNAEGKIDLSPYSAILSEEFTRFNAVRKDIEDRFEEDVQKTEEAFNRKYNNPPKSRFVEIESYEDEDSEIRISFDGPSSNDRELIAMMAVRFEQDLENPEAKDYLRYMARKGRTQSTVIDRTYEHSPGCVLVELEVPPKKEPETKPPKPNPGGGSHVVPGLRSIVKPSKPNGSDPEEPTEPEEPTFERKYVCPTHRELSINVHVLTIDELYAADDYVGGGDTWEGWTEENRDWVEALLAMDWAELYFGFRPSGVISVTSPISPEEERHIWESLKGMTGNDYGAAGLMGNLFCESRLLSTNLEDQYEGILGYTNESYTSAVDSGAYQNFVEDAAGYGLAQWTYNTRKAGLLRMAQSQGVSIGDLDMQLQYLKHELQGSKLDFLANCTSVQEASDFILYKFENPRNPDSLRDTRAGISSYYYNKYVLGTSAEGDLTQAQMDVIRIATNSGAYGVAANAGYCQAWAANVYGRAGFPIDNSSCARVSGERYGVSSDFTTVPPGAAVYGYSSSKYGHVGIYVGGGQVYHNVGGVAVDSLAEWVRKYNGFAWGWQAGTDLTALP